MEQVSALSNMNVSSVPASPQVLAADAKRDTKEKDTDAASFASSSTVTPVNVETAKEAEGEATKTASAGEVKTARERALAGLDKNNFETEVHQVMGTLNNWWGGVKKQVSEGLALWRMAS
jgi:hypothetical protein